METLDQRIVSQLNRIRDTVFQASGQRILDDELFPLFGYDLLELESPFIISSAGPSIVSSPVNLRLGAEITLPKVSRKKPGEQYAPATFLDREPREAFLKAAGLDKKGVPATIGEMFFPLRRTITLGGIRVRTGRGDFRGIFLGTETQLRFPGASPGEDRFLAMVRDPASDHSKGGLLAPGMTLAHSPNVCALNSLNEKSAILIKEGDEYRLLFFTDQKRTAGMTACQKWDQIPLIVERIKENYGTAADGITEKNIELLTVELNHDTDTQRFETPLTITYGNASQELTERSRHVIQHVPGIRALSLLTTFSMPENIAGIPVQNLVDGENLFLADVFKDYKRPTFLVTAAELKYAQTFANASSGWSQYGAMMPGFAWRADQYPDVAPARSIAFWRDGELQQKVFVGGQNDDFTLAPAEKGPTPQRKGPPEPA